MRAETGGAVGASSDGTPVTANASANTKGSYTELIASTAFDAQAIMIGFGLQSVNGSMLFDIAVGGAGSEVVVIPDILSASKNCNEAQSFILPFSCPAGSRVSARCQGTTGAMTKEIVVTLVSRWMLPFSRLTTYGAATGSSRGVSVDGGGSANTKGAYTQIVASTTNKIRALWILTGHQADTTRTTCNYLMDFSIGGAGSEQIVLGDLILGCDANHDSILPAVFGPFFVDIPSVTRLAARCQCSIITAGDRAFDVTVIGAD